jgi:hypothetical protein
VYNFSCADIHSHRLLLPAILYKIRTAFVEFRHHSCCVRPNSPPSFGVLFTRVFQKISIPKTFIHSAAMADTYRSIRCTPLAVSTTWLTSPGSRAKAAVSNSFCISPGPKNPLAKKTHTLASMFTIPLSLGPPLFPPLPSSQGLDSWHSQIAPLPRTATITLTNRQIPQRHLPRPDTRLVRQHNLNSLLLCPRNLRLTPATRPPAILVLDQQMRGPDFALVPERRRIGRRARGARGVVGRHVGFQKAGVCAGGGLPARLLCQGVEVVGQVFGLGVAHLPGRWQAGFGRCIAGLERRDAVSNAKGLVDVVVGRSAGSGRRGSAYWGHCGRVRRREVRVDARAMVEEE